MFKKKKKEIKIEEKKSIVISNEHGKENNLNESDIYNLTKAVPVANVKQYLVNEYERAFKREEYISHQEKELDRLRDIEREYDAMLVVQEKTLERYNRQDENLKKYRQQVACKNEEIKLLKCKNADIELNFQKHLKDLKKEIETIKKTNKTTSKMKK